MDKASHSAKCTITNEQGFVPIDSIQYPLLCSKASDQEATVLIPYQLYSRPVKQLGFAVIILAIADLDFERVVGV